MLAALLYFQQDKSPVLVFLLKSDMQSHWWCQQVDFYLVWTGIFIHSNKIIQNN